MKKMDTTISINALEYTCQRAAEDVIDFFIEHDNDLLYNFKENVHLIDKVNDIDKTLSPIEIKEYFINLKAELISKGCELTSGPFINEKDDPNMKSMQGVRVHTNKKDDDSYIEFGVSTLVPKIITEVVRYR